MTKPKPVIFVELYRRETPIRKRERWGVRVIAENHKVLFSSEKYHNHEDALHAADLLCTGKLTLVDVA